MSNHIYILPWTKAYHTFAEYLFLSLIDVHGKTLLIRSHQVHLDYGQTKHVWYTQQLIAADTTFSVPRSSSYTHQVSNCHSNLVTTPASSINLTSKSVHSLSLRFLCRIFWILDKLKIEMTKDSLEKTCVMLVRMGSIPVSRISIDIISTHTTSTSNIIDILRIASFLLDLNINSPRYYHAFKNYVKTTFNNGLSLSEVDLIQLKRETTNHGSNLMEVEWGGNIDSNYTSMTKHVPSLMEVDWGGSIDPNYISDGCMLMQVDWGGKLEVNHINEYMPSEVDWGAHETHQNGHSIKKVDWGDYDPTLYTMD